MSRRSNFIDANDNFRDQNLRFVRNDLEDNINQFFGGNGDNPSGSGPSGSGPPPRDSIIVQPKPGNNAKKSFRSTELDQRRQYILQLGLKRQQAHNLAVATMRVPDFSLRNLKQQRFRLSIETGVSRQGEVEIQILRDINALVDAHKQKFQNRPCTPPPPSDINWNASQKILRQNETNLVNNMPARRTVGNIRGHRVEESEPDMHTRQSQNVDQNQWNFERNENRRDFVRNEQNLDRNENMRTHQLQHFKDYKYITKRDLSFDRNVDFRERQPEILQRHNNFFEREHYFEREDNFHGHQSENFERKENLCDKRTSNFGRDDSSQEHAPQNWRNNDRFFEMDQHFFRENNFSESQQQYFSREDNLHESEFNFEPDDKFRGSQTQNFERKLNLHNAGQNFERYENCRGRLTQSFEDTDVLQGHQLHSFEKNEGFYENSSSFDGENNFRGHQFFQGIDTIRYKYFNNSQLNGNSNTNEAFDFNQRNTDCEDLKSDDFNNCRPNNFDFHRNSRQTSPDSFNRFRKQDQRKLNKNIQKSNINKGGFWSRFNESNKQRFNDERSQNYRENYFKGKQFGRSYCSNFNNRNEHFYNNDRKSHRSNDFGQQVKNFGSLSEENFPHRIQTVFYENQFKSEYDALLDVDGRLAVERRNVENYESERTLEIPVNLQSEQELNHNPGEINQNMYQSRGQFKNRSAKNNSLGRPIQWNNAQNNVSQNNNEISLNRPTTNTRISGQRSNQVVNKPPIMAAAIRTVDKPAQLNKKLKNKPNMFQAIKINTQGPTNRAGTNYQSTAPSSKRTERKRAGAATNAKTTEKRKRITNATRGFLVGDFRLPYINNNTKILPQPEDQSLAVTFFEQKPFYNTSMYVEKDDDGINAIDSDGYEDSEDNAILKSSIQFPSKQLKTIRNRIENDWHKMYHLNKYNSWQCWWKDFKWCEQAMNEKLEKFGSIYVKNRFLPNYPEKSTNEVIAAVMKSAHFALEKNTATYLRNSRTVFVLMNTTFLENVSKNVAEQLQDMIRGIPNHIWVHKVRALVYIWAEYYKIMNSKKKDEMAVLAVQCKWRSPTFHWMCKQFFDELKAISAIEWPEHSTQYSQIK